MTVASAMCRAAAISALDRPRATSSRIARSRSLSAASRESSTGASGRVPATCSSSRRVAVGATIASPDATARIAASSSSGCGVLEQEAAGAGAQRGEHVLVEVERRQDDHARRRVAVALDQHPRRRDAVEPGHADVHQHDVGGGDREALERLAAVLGLADHRHVGLRVDHHPQTGADERLVVDQEDAGHARSSATSPAGAGSRARTS